MSATTEIVAVTDPRLPGLLALDQMTLSDYPGGDATRHPALTPVRAAPGPHRFGSGVFDEGGLLLAITYVDVSADARAETDFTVVRPGHRGLGLGRAVKAASVLALLERHVRVFRTGGAAENTAIIAVNRALGYVRDEEWVTLER